MTKYTEFTPTEDMKREADRLNQGGIMVVYTDENTIRMETVSGRNPYVWRHNTWIPMREWKNND